MTLLDLARCLTESPPLQDYQSSCWRGDLIISAGLSSQEKSFSWEENTARDPLRESLQTGRLPQLTSASRTEHAGPVELLSGTTLLLLAGILARTLSLATLSLDLRKTWR